jgi:hypothetical protein
MLMTMNTGMESYVYKHKKRDNYFLFSFLCITSFLMTEEENESFLCMQACTIKNNIFA